MKRRNFLLSSLLGGAAMSLPLVNSCKPENGKSDNAQPVSYKSELDEITINELQDGMKSGKYTSESLVEIYTERIRAIDKSGPVLNSIIEMNPDAPDIARKLDSERKSGKVRGPLHGIPIVIKDNIDTADKMITSAGSLALVKNVASGDAFIVSRLREAGAVILAKTNLSEWANFRSGRSTSGWSGRGGLTRNPYMLNRNPCGSSSGTGVAVSANLCVAGIGTETDGSIVCPSNMNGLVGIKPTLGLCSRSGIIPISASQDTAGPMARTVADAAALLGALTGTDSKDPVTLESAGKVFTDYTQFLNPDGLKGVRVGVARNFFGFHNKVDALMEEVIRKLEALGARIIDPANIEFVRECGEAEYQVLLYEFKDGLNKYLAGLDPSLGIKTLEDVIRFNTEHAEEELRYFGQEIMIEAQKKGPLTDAAYLRALSNVRKYSRHVGIDSTLKKRSLDVIIAPTGGPAWVTDLINGDHYSGGSSTPAACAGYPSITVPAGFIEGLPVGVSFIGTAWSEPKLISYAYAFEQASKYRKTPEFLEGI
ncbi:MAG: amidase [Bacteroidetes bacterium]|nr:amidase [Bacteroidota bacterium]